MSITESDIQKLASLARISISEEERKTFAKEIESILGYIEQLNRVSAEVGSNSAVGSQVVGSSSTCAIHSIPAHRNQLREDQSDTALNPDAHILVEAAPRSEIGMVKVKKILN
jgi:aspartyl/glutamyl-tRNA(Asn/Gln) amidotransferase C subunit